MQAPKRTKSYFKEYTDNKNAIDHNGEAIKNPKQSIPYKPGLEQEVGEEG